jgi:hypothetical protein
LILLAPHEIRRKVLAQEGAAPGRIGGRKLHDTKRGIARAVRKLDRAREVKRRIGADALRGQLALRGIGIVGGERDRAVANATAPRPSPPPRKSLKYCSAGCGCEIASSSR